MGQLIQCGSIIWCALRNEHDLRWWQWWRSRSLASLLADWVAQPLQCYHGCCCCCCNCLFCFIFFLFCFFCAAIHLVVSNLRTDCAHMNESKSRRFFSHLIFVCSFFSVGLLFLKKKISIWRLQQQSHHHQHIPKRNSKSIARQRNIESNERTIELQCACCTFRANVSVCIYVSGKKKVLMRKSLLCSVVCAIAAAAVVFFLLFSHVRFALFADLFR